MVIVKLKGGLGNQMFQYAFAKHMANKNNTLLKIDISFFETQTLRSYELGIFSIPERTISSDELVKYIPSGSDTIPQRIRNKWKSLRYNFKFIIERQFHFDPDLLQLHGNLYLDGYWQSEKYFEDIAPLIRKDFQPIPEIKQQFNDQAKEVKNCDSVAVHIRRGDYVSDKKTHKEHGTLSFGYYDEAIKMMSRKLKYPVFYIFSDDIEWVKQNMKIDYPHHFVDNREKQLQGDLYLMSLCHHQIIANSSFSWWAAWLNSDEKKLVIAPKKWFNESTKNMKDIIPEKWIKL